MYKIAICDDDKDYINELEDIISECNEKKVLFQFYEFDSGEKLLNEFKLVPQISNESIADAIAYPASVSFSSWIWNRSVLFGRVIS